VRGGTGFKTSRARRPPRGRRTAVSADHATLSREIRLTTGPPPPPQSRTSGACGLLPRKGRSRSGSTSGARTPRPRSMGTAGHGMGAWKGRREGRRRLGPTSRLECHHGEARCPPRCQTRSPSTPDSEGQASRSVLHYLKQKKGADVTTSLDRRPAASALFAGAEVLPMTYRANYESLFWVPRHAGFARCSSST